MIEAINDIDSIRCMVEDIHEEMTNTPDHWEKLKHQYAGMAMQGLMAERECINFTFDDMADISVKYATALVEKLKEEK